MRRCHAADWAHGRFAFAAAPFANEIASQFCLQNPLRSKHPYAPILRTSQRNGVGPPKKSAIPRSTACHSSPGAEVTRTVWHPYAAAADACQSSNACGPRQKRLVLAPAVCRRVPWARQPSTTARRAAAGIGSRGRRLTSTPEIGGCTSWTGPS